MIGERHGLTHSVSMDKKTLKLIRQSEWFENLPDEIIQQLLERVIWHSLKPDEALIKKGDTDNSMFLILEGWVKVVIPDDVEGEIVVNHVGPGELVGEMSLIDQRPRSATVIALSDLTTLEFTRQHFLEIMDAFPILGLHMVATMSNRMRFVLTYLENAVLWSQKIAEGDYSFLDEEDAQSQQEGIVDNSRSDEVRASRFLAAFFNMAQGVKKREKELQEQVYRLTIQIDRAKRDAEISEITESKFFEKLKSDTSTIRGDRKKPKD